VASVIYKNILRNKFVRFLFVGGLNTMLNYGIYALLIYLGFSYSLAITVAFIAGLMINFKTQGRFVFNSRSNRPFLLYVASWLGIYFVNLWLLGILIANGIDSYLAGALMIPPIAVLSFFVLKYAVFREKKVILQ